MRIKLLLAAALCLAGHTYLALALGLSVDEAHYALYAAHPALSYFDHPPLVGWLQIPFVWLGGADWLLRVVPLVLWSIRQSSQSRAHFEAAGGYTVNILSHAQHKMQDLAMRFTKNSQAERFAGLELVRLPSGRPQIVGSTAWFDCAIERIIGVI